MSFYYAYTYILEFREKLFLREGPAVTHQANQNNHLTWLAFVWRISNWNRTRDGLDHTGLGLPREQVGGRLQVNSGHWKSHPERLRMGI